MCVQRSVHVLSSSHISKVVIWARCFYSLKKFLGYYLGSRWDLNRVHFPVKRRLGIYIQGTLKLSLPPDIDFIRKYIFRYISIINFIKFVLLLYSSSGVNASGLHIHFWSKLSGSELYIYMRGQLHNINS